LGALALSAPQPILDEHDAAGFDCGEASLDDWLRRRALPNQASGASRTYVVCARSRIVAYYCIAAGALAVAGAPGAFRRNMPDPVPVVLLGRLAVDRGWQRRGVAAAMLQDAVLRAAQAADVVGVRGIIVHALSDSAKAFYEHHGFRASPSAPMTLALSLKRPR
jgi:GNAT superfamily N-acetyltransferase